MIVLFRGSQIEAMNIKNLLDNAEIESFIQNQQMSVIEPWVVTAGGFNPAYLQINSVGFEEAKKILDDFNNGNLESNLE